MKRTAFIITAFILITAASCKKYYPSYSSVKSRTIQYVLYTQKDFRNDTHTIDFSIFIRTHNTTLFDSSLATMQVKDIPDSLHAIVILKKVPNDDGADIAAGFHYKIDGVGNASYTDTLAAGITFKKVEFSFR